MTKVNHVPHDDPHEDARPPSVPWHWMLLGVTTFAAWALYAGFRMGWAPETLGPWGDSFAPLTGLSSTFTLVFALWSIHMQRRELELQRAELRLTRQEMALQREEMAAQRAAQETGARAQQAAAAAQDRANLLAEMANRMTAIDLARSIDASGVQAVKSVMGGAYALEPADSPLGSELAPIRSLSAEATWARLLEAQSTSKLGGEPWHRRVLAPQVRVALQHRLVLAEAVKDIYSEAIL